VADKTMPDNATTSDKTMPANTAPDKTKLGVGLFLLSEANFFLILLITYVYFHSQPSSGPSASNSLDPMRTLVFSICLFLSSATIHLAGRSFKLGESRAVSGWLALTLALGAIFLVGQVTEYLGLFAHGVSINTNLFGSTFFTLTGFHGLHVLIGLFALAALLGIAMNGRVAEIKPSGFEAVSMYWHFVDAVWVVIFAAVYLWPLVA
jgi:heme/copper-type cytochrome/quinol oxidase subunit 3